MYNQSDRESFAVDPKIESATAVFEPVNYDTLRDKQAKEYGENMQYMLDKNAPLPRDETATTMSYYPIQNDLLFKRTCQDISEKEAHSVVS